MNLSGLLDIIKDPENPAFEQAVAQLIKLIPAELDRDDIPALLSQIDTTIATLTEAKNNTAAQLQKLRTQANAAQSYGTRK